MPQQPTSLLSLPDELLVQTFDYLADPPLEGIHPLRSLSHVCRRVREVAQTVLYRDVCLDPGWGTPPHFRAAVTQNPSLGQLVSSLDMHDDVDTSYFSRDGVLDRKTRAALRTLARLKEVHLWGVTTDEAASILAALPSPPWRSLDVEMFWTADPSHWRDLQTQLSRFSQLHDLYVLDDDLSSPRLAHAPRATRRSPRHLTLPQVVELHVADYILVEGFGSTGPLRQTLPNLRELHLHMSQSENAAVVSATLAELSSSLTTLELIGREPWEGVAVGTFRICPPSFAASKSVTNLLPKPNCSPSSRKRRGVWSQSDLIRPTRSPIAYFALSPDLNARRAYATYASTTCPFEAQTTFETSSSVVVGKEKMWKRSAASIVHTGRTAQLSRVCGLRLPTRTGTTYK